MPEISYGNKKIEYKVVRTDRKTVGIQVDLEKGVIIRSPKFLSTMKIRQLVKKKANWILRKKEKMRQIKPPPKRKEFLTGEELPYLGRKYQLVVNKAKIKKASVKLYQGKFHVQVNAKLSAKKRKNIIRNEFIRWYRNKAEVQIKQRVKKYQTKLRVKSNKVKIKQQKTRWGSCSSKGNLNFNWRLIMAPKSVIDYLVVHELAHLLYSNHSQGFWQIVGSLVPDYKEKQEWLRINSRQLRI